MIKFACVLSLIKSTPQDKLKLFSKVVKMGDIVANETKVQKFSKGGKKKIDRIECEFPFNEKYWCLNKFTNVSRNTL